MTHSKLIARAGKSLRNVLRNVAPRLLAHHIRKTWNKEPEILLLPALCDRTRVSFDVGASWGLYTAVLRDISGGVVACEPIPQLARFLRRSYGGNVRVEQVALSSTSGKAEFFISKAWGLSSLRGSIEDAQKRIIVRLETLDSIATSAVGFIKIDVEGHEEEVIEGAKKVIDRDRPVVLVEIEDRRRPGSMARILQRMSAQGYSGFFLEGGSLREIAGFRPPIIKAHKRPFCNGRQPSREGPHQQFPVHS